MTTDTVVNTDNDIPWDGTVRGYVPGEHVVVDPALPLHRTADADLDPVTYQVIKNALANINFEHADLLQRLSLSPVVMLARDFQASLLTEDAEVVCLGAGVVYFSNQNSLTIRYIMENWAAEDIQPGDMLLSSDPYIGSAHQSDVTVTAPVFVDGELFCWVANSMHFQDVGGSLPGSMVVHAADVWEEPMLVPPVTLVRGDKIRKDVENLFVRQSRYPNMTRMDLRAAIGGASATRDKIITLVGQYGSNEVKTAMRRVLDAGEKLFSDRLAAIPDGRWTHRSYVEGAFPGDTGIYPQQISIEKRGTTLHVDNAGTAPQKGGGNLTYAGFSGVVLAALTQQLVPELAGSYGGAYRRVRFEPISGLMNCAEYPAGVSASGMRMAALQCSLAGAVVSKMLACGDESVRNLSLGPCAPNLNSVMAAGVETSGSPFLMVDADGLMGSLAGRPQRDGVDAGGQWWIPDAMVYNCEELEAQSPVVVLARAMDGSNTGGSGRFRAGVAYHETLLFRGVLGGALVNYQNESFTTGQGLFGGSPGSMARCRIKRGTDALEQFRAGELPVDIDDIAGEEIPLVHMGAPAEFGEGDVVQWTSPAAPGYGDPLLRDPELVAKDFAEELVDADRALRVFGVVLSDGRPDVEATNSTRHEALVERLGGREPGAIIDAPAGAVPVGEMLHVLDGRWWCNGADLGPSSETYKDKCLVRTRPIRQSAPEFEVVDQVMADRVTFTEYLCPVTGLRIDTEIMADDDTPLYDVEIASV
ncbi:hydantoinase B/oxoprolinase family protein [Nocardia fluminea]|uniref:hydantoinase B/oxoprolinase family protein n=1 Tax=Nocardia fluminea TaxID=134984 RepID=UPI00366A901B